MKKEQKYKIKSLLNKMKNPFILFAYANKKNKAKSIKKNVLSNPHCYDKKIDELVKGYGYDFHFDLAETSTMQKEQAIALADKILNNHFVVLNHEIDNLFDSNSGSYLWNFDYETGLTVPFAYHSQVMNDVAKQGIDVKHIWEFGRLQCLYPLSLAFVFANKNEYLKKVIAIVEDFDKNNQLFFGPQWSCTMEVGIRLSNICVAFLILKNYLDDETESKFYRIMAKHELYISLFPEKTMNRRHNHYFGNLLGLISASFFKKDDRELKKNINNLYQDINYQFLSDGVHFEGSTAYHRLCLDMVGVSLLFGKLRGVEIPSYVANRLQAAIDFAICASNCKFIFPRFGDSDSGRVLTLPSNDKETNSFLPTINLISYCLSDKIIAIDNQDDYLFLYKNNDIVERKVFSSLTSFTQGGYYVYQNDNYKVVVRALTRKPIMFTHDHEDAGSFVLIKDDKFYFVDPGTHNYKHSLEREIYRSAQSHSSLSIDRYQQKAFINNFNCVYLVKIATKALNNEIKMTFIYPQGLVANRTFTFSKDEFFIKDEVNKDTSLSMCCNLENSGAQIKDDTILCDNIINIKVKNWLPTLTKGSYSFSYDSISTFDRIAFNSKERQNEIICRIKAK